MNIKVINNTKYPIRKKQYEIFLEQAFLCAKIKKDASLVFVDNEKMREYNKYYRKKDKPTDILTFTTEGDKNYAADIIISYEWALSEYKKIRDGIFMLIIHGTLHVKGVHHTYSEKSLRENHEKMIILYKEVIKKYKDYENKK